MNLSPVLDWLETAGVVPEELDTNTLIRFVEEELEEFKEAVENNDEDEMYDAISDSLIFTANLMYKFNLNQERLNQYLKAVVKSNWTKFCKTEQEAISTVNAYQLGLHPTKLGKILETYYVESNKYWIVKQKSDNKILKSILYKEPKTFLND